jgi:hypothetical protein
VKLNSAPLEDRGMSQHAAEHSHRAATAVQPDPHPLPISAGMLLAGLAALLVTAGCGPVRSTQAISKAEVEFERARVVGAHNKAPYEYHSAKQYLHKAKEEWGYSEFQAALDYAEEAERAAESARRKAKEDPWEDPVEDREGDGVGDNDEKNNDTDNNDTSDGSDDSDANEAESDDDSTSESDDESGDSDPISLTRTLDPTLPG